MNVKKNRFKEEEYNENLKYKLIETYNHEFYTNNNYFGNYSINPDFQKILEERFLDALKQKEPDKKFVLSPIPYKELVDKVWKLCNLTTDSVAENILNFINNSKIYGFSAEQVEKRLESEKWSPMQKYFGRISCKIYKDYKEYLNSNSKIDYQDMINLCIDTLLDRPELFKDTFDHILIDEYQDMSKQRYKLVKLLMDRNPKCKLFAVGDDWQSIMGFSGSDLDYFVNFEKYFNNHEPTPLKTNYRSNKTIVDAGAHLIKNNKDEQIKKESIANNEKEKNILVWLSGHESDYYPKYYEQIANHCMNSIETLLNNGYKSNDIMILMRIKKNPLLRDKIRDYARVRKIPFDSVHKVKGKQSRVVFLLNVREGLYGFPCELQNPFLLEPSNDKKIVKKENEERRLFYVALTRAKEEVYIYSQKCLQSKFIDEIKPFIEIENLFRNEYPKPDLFMNQKLQLEEKEYNKML